MLSCNGRNEGFRLNGTLDAGTIGRGLEMLGLEFALRRVEMLVLADARDIDRRP